MSVYTPGNPTILGGANGVPAYNVNPNNIQRLRLSVANALSGTSSSKWLFVGTSQMRGEGLAAQGTQNITAQIIAILNRALGAGMVVPGFVGMDPTDTSGDPRYTGVVAAGWTFPETLGLCALNNFRGAPSAVTNVVFTPGAFNGSIDSFDFYTIGGSLSGTSHVNFSGGVTVNNNTNAGTPTSQKWTVNGAAATTNFLTLLPSGTFNVDYYGIEPYLAAATNIRIGLGAISGFGTSGNWAKNAGGQTLPCIAAYAPNVIFAEINIDDAVAAAPVASGTFLTNLQQCITNWQALPADVILLTSARPLIGSSYSDPDTVRLAQIVYQLAAQNNCLCIDLLGRYGPYTGGWGTGGFSLGAVHYNIPGCVDAAGAIANAILAIAA